MDYLEMDITPYEEDCAQLGSESYLVRCKLEFVAIVVQLKRIFGEPPEGVYFKLKSCPHDFGTYYELKIVFDDSNENAVSYAYSIEDDFPKNWDKEALEYLKQNGYYQRTDSQTPCNGIIS